MESYKSSLTDSTNGVASSEESPMLESLRGRKSIENAEAKDTLLEETKVVSEEDSVESTESVDTDTDDDWESDEESDDEEEDEEWEERMAILRDAKNLKKFAGFYLHPEAPIKTDAFATARCYFDRASAPESDGKDLQDERDRVLAEAKALKHNAVDYMHPERPVVAEDPTLFGRNYFGRASAEDQEQYSEERERILEDMKQLKKLAVDYMHPERPVVAEDPTLFGRNYFGRASAEDQEQYSEERERILEDMNQLKKLAVDYMHPERPVVAEDPTLFGRNYFGRASAEDQEQYSEERERILEDMNQLKKLAVDYMHPERPVVAEDPTLFGRNYFGRASAEDQEQYSEEREHILEDMKQLKKLAVDYMHPECPVVAEDPALFGRNYFGRASAEDQEQYSEEREHILEDMKQLKKLAVDYMHPERPVVAEDPTLFGRNYFGRASAEDQEQYSEERERILEDMKQLKKLAVDYMHPERPVVAEDPTLFGRNYFGRASAEDQEQYSEERERILEDMKQLKKLAVDYMHPERPVVAEDPTLFGRNYFGRASAEDQEQYSEEREHILEDMKQLKKLAVDYMHPERPVVAEDPTLFGRNYFGRASAEDQEQYSEERERILEDMKQLKKLAVDYMHPERPVVAEDPALFGRNYFNRPSAPVQEDMEVVQERERVLADAAKLKKLAVDYKHPEIPVKTADATLFGRNYFSRPSAPTEESREYSLERERVLADAAKLKQLAVEFLHPENPVVTSDGAACGRNFFDRPSARIHDQMVHTFPAHEDDHHEDHHHIDHFGMDDYEQFGMDEDVDHMFDDMRNQFVAPAAPQAAVKPGSDDEEGNLSRSPSSVMLFTGESVYD